MQNNNDNNKERNILLKNHIWKLRLVFYPEACRLVQVFSTHVLHIVVIHISAFLTENVLYHGTI